MNKKGQSLVEYILLLGMLLMIGVSIFKSDSFKDNVIEVQTTLALVPNDNNFDKINALVTYSTLVKLDKSLKDKKRLEEIILIEIPNEVYPELRKVFIIIFENSGFREIKIDANVDFKKLYLSRKN